MSLNNGTIKLWGNIQSEVIWGFYRIPTNLLLCVDILYSDIIPLITIRSPKDQHMHTQRCWGWLNSSSPPVGFPKSAPILSWRLIGQEFTEFTVILSPEDPEKTHVSTAFRSPPDPGGVCWLYWDLRTSNGQMCRLDSHHYFRCDVCVCVCWCAVGVSFWHWMLRSNNWIYIYIIQMYIFYIWT